MLFSKRINIFKFSLCIAMMLSPMACGKDVPLGMPEKNTIAGIEVEHIAVDITSEDRRTEPGDAIEICLDEMEDVLIENGGDYILSGALNGSVRIDAEDQIVHLFLDNVSIRATKGPAIYVETAGKLVITLLEGTENVIRDGGSYIKYVDADACIYAVSDVSINGKGTLSLIGQYEDAVHTKDVFKAIDTSINIRAKADGLHANDGAYIVGGDLKIEAEQNGVRTTKTGKSGKGCIVIQDCNLAVIAGEYAISASQDVSASNSSLYLKGILGNVRAGGKIFIGEECSVDG